MTSQAWRTVKIGRELVTVARVLYITHSCQLIAEKHVENVQIVSTGFNLGKYIKNVPLKVT